MVMEAEHDAPAKTPAPSISSTVIRPYREDDYGSCAALWEDAGLRVHTPQQIRLLLSGAGGALVAEIEDEAGERQLIGAALWSHNGQMAMLWRLTVASAFRGQGIAKRLLHRVEQDARQIGLGGLSLLTRETNHAAQSLYRSQGFHHNTQHQFWGKRLEEQAT